MVRMISWVIAIVAVLTTLTGCSLPQVSAEERLFLPLSVEFLGSYTLEEKTFQNTTIGGLSAIAYDRQKDVYYAVSDDRSDRNPARFYTLKLDVDTTTGKPTLKQVRVEGVTFLKDESGQPFATGTIDAEGIALSPMKSAFIASEGFVREGVPPMIGEFDLETGQLRRKLSIPDPYLPNASGINQTRGVRNNLAFESLTTNPGAATGMASEPFRLFTATESALVQDLDLPDSQQGLKNRLLHYLIEGKRSTTISDHLYQLDPKPTGAIEHGLSELLAIDQSGHFLSLERSFGLQGFKIKLFQVANAGASDTSASKSLKGELKGVQPARKRLLLDLNELGIRLDNLEGMTIGARLPNGSQSLVLVSDDNFNSIAQVTQFLLFRLKGT